ncbi:unnamed protein product [Ranitomeya imitator]|uniref:INTS6/SAGE1/DDX26B/CT45 C-terminal domain-containing protein n=1 Tax=Ranitomeya imitator TaxID=111125 RepID=A0ABN9MN68_9NEOB|nr:unnamed protein product [Ranitomeya imitator]
MNAKVPSFVSRYRDPRSQEGMRCFKIYPGQVDKGNHSGGLSHHGHDCSGRNQGSFNKSGGGFLGRSAPGLSRTGNIGGLSTALQNAADKPLMPGMMIDEADEFVTGHQNKHKRPGEPNMQGVPKRRRCMSPLLRNRPPSPVVNNHVGGKGSPAPAIQSPADMPKPAAINKHPSLHNILPTENAENYDDDDDEEHLCTEEFLSDSDDFESLSQDSLNSLLSTANSTENGDPDCFDSNNSNLFIGRSKPPGDLGNCFNNGTAAFSHKMRRLRPCRSYEEVNVELKRRIMKEIRKPGRTFCGSMKPELSVRGDEGKTKQEYETIFSLLKDVQGNLQARLHFLQNVIKEAARFKKRMLIEQLEEFLEEIHKANQVNHVNSS